MTIKDAEDNEMSSHLPCSVEALVLRLVAVAIFRCSSAQDGESGQPALILAVTCSKALYQEG